MSAMPTVPDSTKTSLEQRLSARARERWPALDHISVRHRAGFAYITGHLPDGQTLPWTVPASVDTGF